MSNLPDCDRELHQHGEHIATIINLKPEEIEAIVIKAREESGQRIDWHYVGGRAAVRMLGDEAKAVAALKEALKNICERNYRFTTPQDSVMPFPPTWAKP